jgi:hypothetical protein
MTETQSKEDVMMNKPVELSELTDNPAARRLWLLHNALRCLPFDRAIELARAAEAFLTGSAAEDQVANIRIDAEAPIAPDLEPTEQLITEISGKLRSVELPRANKSARLALSAECRDRLLDRLADNAKNAELAAEFGLTSKQVQGIRMGCAREIAQRREQLSKRAQGNQASPDATSAEEVVRYLRQQDDVVVPQEKGEFLVNGRFRMPFRDLVVRANRIRARQGKSMFNMPPNTTSRPDISSANGHPLFWKESGSPGGRPNGSHHGSHQPSEIETEGA